MSLLTTTESSENGRTAGSRWATRRLRYVPLVAAALIASGCDTFDSPDAQQGGICVDEHTQQRVNDEACGDYDEEGISGSSGFFFMWMSTSSNHTVPAVGSPVPATIGSRTVPAGTPIAKGLPAAGGSMPSISRGGFGAKSGNTAGVGGRAGSGGS